MFIVWKEKGILIILYFFISMIIVIIPLTLLKGIIKIILPDGFSFHIVFGLSLLITGFFTSLSAIDYINDNGIKKIYNEDHTLFFLKMKYWKFVFYILGIALFIFGLIDTIFKITKDFMM